MSQLTTLEARKPKRAVAAVGVSMQDRYGTLVYQNQATQEVWSSGLNRNAQAMKAPNPDKPVEPPSLLGALVSVSAICLGYKATAQLKGGDGIILFGSNAFHQLPTDSKGGDTSPIVGETKPSTFIKGSIGVGHSVFLEKDTNILRGFGLSNTNQLGYGSGVVAKDMALNVGAGVLLPLDVPVKDIQCGANFTAILYEDGAVWLCGKMSAGPHLYPTWVRIATSINQISAGWAHLLLLNNSGQVFGMGSNMSGQMGEQNKGFWAAPIRIDGVDGCKQISAGMTHNVALKEDGLSAIVWGLDTFNKVGGIGSPTLPRKVSYAADLIGVQEIKSVCAGSFATHLEAATGIYSKGCIAYNDLVKYANPVLPNFSKII